MVQGCLGASISRVSNDAGYLGASILRVSNDAGVPSCFSTESE